METIETKERVDIVDITEQVNATIPDELNHGLCNVFVAHTTAGIVVNEAEGRLLDDIETVLGQLIPETEAYRHDQIDANAAAHLRSILLGSNSSVPIEGGTLALGTWQSLLLVESDGPRSRRIEVRCMAT